jgi:hypothetical protein
MGHAFIAKPLKIFTVLFLITCAIASLIAKDQWDYIWISLAYLLLVVLPLYLKWKRDEKRRSESEI